MISGIMLAMLLLGQIAGPSGAVSNYSAAVIIGTIGAIWAGLQIFDRLGRSSRNSEMEALIASQTTLTKEMSELTKQIAHLTGSITTFDKMSAMRYQNVMDTLRGSRESRHESL